MGPGKPKFARRSIRLNGYDYSAPGAYFITLVTYRRMFLFGDINDGCMTLSPIGKIVLEEWFASARIRREIRLAPEDFVIMPNHIHGIVQIMEVPGVGVGASGQTPLPPPKRKNYPHGPAPHSLSSFVVGFKSSVTLQARAIDRTLAGSIWQRNFYEHIILNECEWMCIREYIRSNPAQWEYDRENLHG